MSANDLGHCKWAAFKGQTLLWGEGVYWCFKYCHCNVLFSCFLLISKNASFMNQKKTYYCNVPAWFGYSLRLMVRYQRLEELGVLRFPDTGSNTDSSIKPMSHPAIGSNYQMSAHLQSFLILLVKLRTIQVWML